MKRQLTLEECENTVTGEITLTAVMAICAIAIVAVIAYKLFTSTQGSGKIPGGWQFSWK